MKPALTLATSITLGLITLSSAAQSGYAATPKKGGTLTFNLQSEPTTLNPLTSTDGYASRVQGFLLETLASRNEDTYEWQPLLASSWVISKDGKTFTFKIRKGVKWHDGVDLTVEDVAFSFNAIFDPKYKTAHMRPYYEGIAKVEILDSETVKFTTKDTYFKNFEVTAGLTILPKHIYGDPVKGSKINRELVGSGPYVIGKYERGKRIVLERNKAWWGANEKTYADQYNVDQLILKFVKEDAVSFEMLKKGELDYEAFTAETYIEKAKGPEWGTKLIKVKTENKGPRGYGFFAWNLKRPLLQDKRVRLALYHLINRKLMNEKFRYGMSTLATGPWDVKSEYASTSVKAVDYNPKKAIELLKEAGFTDSDKDGLLDRAEGATRVPLKLTLLNANKDFEKYLTLFKEDASKAGVQIDVKYVEWNSFVKLMDEGKFDVIGLAWGGGSVDIDPKQIWHSSSAVAGGSNFIGYSNPEVDKLIEKARVTMNKQARIPILKKAYELIAADVPYAFLFNEQFVFYGHTSRVKKPKDSFKFGIGTDYWWVE